MDAHIGCVVFDNPMCDLHISDTDLPEKPFRTRVIREALFGEMEQDDAFGGLVRMETAAIKYESFMVCAARVHTRQHLDSIEESFLTAEQNQLLSYVSGNEESPVSSGSRAAVTASLAAVIQATEWAHQGRLTRAFCNIRPPGHHACANESMGFCVVNNVAIAVEHALHLNPTHRVSIVDWDNHHGNGLQDIFRTRPNVQYISIHGEFLFNYPAGSGDPCDKGDHGNVLNVSLPIDSGHEVVTNAFTSQVLPALAVFDPTLIYISCGFDAHVRDPVGCLAYESRTYGSLTYYLVHFARHKSQHNPCIISVLEGGYDEQALRESSVAHVRQLAFNY